ncbi:MAG: hypothetical protein AB1757_25485 [Acidobacteriota bacterium]
MRIRKARVVFACLILAMVITNGQARLSTNQPLPIQSAAKHIYENQFPTPIPVLLKSSIYVQAKTQDSYWKYPNERDYSSWVPLIRFKQFYNNERQLNYTVDYFNPDGSLWYSEKLESGISAADRTVMYQSPSPYNGVFDKKSTNGIGIYSFKITDQDTQKVLYQGKFKVGKFSRAYRPQEKNKMSFYVEHDWLLPFGMIGFHHSDIEIGGIMPEVSVWLNGLIDANELEARLFYKGAQIASTKEKGGIVSDYDERAADYVAAFVPHQIWKRWLFQWDKFRIDNRGRYNPDYYPNAHYADKNPGDYTVKIYRNGAQIREMNFTVGADGKFVAPAYTGQIFLPYHRIIVPVKVIGTTEKVNAIAWKTEAFYGNPLNGFAIQ